MQSLHALRLLLNAAAFALALVASSQRAWSVIEPPGGARWTAALSLDASRELLPTASSSGFVRLTFSPNDYCLDAANGTSDCRAYAYQLTQSEHATAAVFNLTAVATAGLDDELLAATSSNRLQAATSSSCVTSLSTPSKSGAWLLHGAQSMLCLVVLETCLYSTLLWQLLGFCSAVCALATLLKYDAFEGGAGFTTLAQTALGMVVLLEWTGYSMYMMDLGYVAVLQLVVHYGASFRLAMLSVLLSLLASGLSTKISGPHATLNLAALYALPSSPRSSNARRRQWSPQGTGTASLPSLDSPEVESEDATLDCLEQALDPLKCPANYRP